ncbi:MAG: glycosyltransferase family 39 protein [bacterium]
MSQGESLSSKDSHRSYAEWFTLAVIVSAALAVRCIGLDRLSLWTDEIHSVWIAKLSFWDFWANPTLVDHPPLYFVLLKIWLSAGDSECWIRLFSALCGTAAIPALYVLSRRVGGPVFARWAAVFLALSPFHVRYSQEARGYALLFLLSVLLLLAASCLRERPSNRRLWWFYAVTATGLTATHAVGILYVLCVSFAFLVPLREWRSLFRPWLAVHIRFLLIASPVLVLLAQQAVFKAYSGFWQTPPGIAEILSTMREYLYTAMPSVEYLVRKSTGLSILPIPLETFAFVPFLALMVTSLLLAYRRRDTQLLRVALPGGLFFVLTVILSYGSVSVFAARTGIPSLVLVPLLLAYSPSFCAPGKSNRVFLVIGVVCIALSALSLYSDFKTYKKEDWRGLVKTLAREIQPGDIVFHWQYITGLGLEHYGEKYGITNPIIGVPQGYREAIFTPYTQVTEERINGVVRRAVNANRRVWVVQYRELECLSPLESQLVDLGFAMKNSRRFVVLDLILYDRPPAS